MRRDLIVRGGAYCAPAPRIPNRSSRIGAEGRITAIASLLLDADAEVLAWTAKLPDVARE